MQIKALIFLASIAVMAQSAFANSVKCSSADQSLSYTRQTSNGGARLDLRTLKFQGQKQVASSFNDPNIDWTISGRQDIDAQISEHFTMTAYVGKATGTIKAGTQSTPFSKVVICEEFTYPACLKCP